MFFNNVQALRGIAALLVFTIHLFSTSADMAPYWVRNAIYAFGPAGVDLFFVISGFVVTLSARKASETHGFKNSLVFMFKRALRIYPLYWVVLGAASIAYPYVWLSPEWIKKAPDIYLITLTYPVNYKVMVAWSLVFEMFFYSVLFITTLFSKEKFYHVLFSIFLIEMLLISGFNSFDGSFVSYVPLNPQVFQFFTGAAIAFAVTNYKVYLGKPILLIGFLIFALMCMVNKQLADWNVWYRTATLTLPCAMLVYGASVSEMHRKFTFGRPLIFLGNISFSLYLWHQITFQTSLYVFDKLGLTAILPKYISLMIWALCGIVMGILSYKFIEKPLVSYINHGVRKLSLQRG